MKRRYHNRTRRTPLAAWRTPLAAWTTIAARTPILATAALTGSPKAMREVRRMVSEKALAAVAGGLAAQRAWLAAWLRGPGLRVGPSDLYRHTSAIMKAATSPAERACRANARRLTMRRGSAHRSRRARFHSHYWRST